MKIENKYFVFIALLLVIITIGGGAVSASQDNITSDEITENENINIDNSEDIISENLNDESRNDEILENTNNDNLSDGDKSYPDIYVGGAEDGGIYNINDKDLNLYCRIEAGGDSNCVLLVDNVLRYNKSISYSYSHIDFNLSNLNLDYGSHTWKVIYEGNDAYYSVSKEGTFNLFCFEIDFPKEVYLDFDDIYGGIKVYLPNNISGKLIVLIDDNVLYNKTVEYEKYYKYIGFYNLLDNLNFGTHKYKITYVDDENQQNYEINGLFDVTYDLNVDLDEYLDYGEDLKIEFDWPNYANGNITVLVNGKSYSKKSSDWDEYFIISDLNLGLNNISVTYGDDFYPTKTLNYTVEVTSEIKIFGPDDYYLNYGEDVIVSLKLPENATGYLHIYTYNGSYENKITIDKIPLKKGYAEYKMHNLNYGNYNFYSCYEGNDYNIDEEYFHFYVSSKIICPEKIWANSTNNYLILEFPNDLSENLTINIYNDDYDLIHILYNGTTKQKINLSIPQLSVGEYDIAIDYGDFYKSFEVIVLEDNPNFDIDDFSGDYLYGGFWESIVPHIPSDVDGRIIIIADGQFILNESAKKFRYHDYSFPHNLTYGFHDVEIKFFDDSYFQPINKTGKIFITYFDCEYFSSETSYFTVSVNEDIKAYLTLSIDGKPYYIGYLDDGYLHIDVNNLSSGNHDYEITYFGDGGKTETKNGSFNYNYPMYIYNEGTFDYGNVQFSIEIPPDGTGYAMVYIDGEFNQIIKDFFKFPKTSLIGNYIFIENLSAGIHKLSVKYFDDKYPVRIIEENFTITDNYVIYRNWQNNDIKLILPENAKGNLVVNVNNTVNKVKLVNGYASFSLNNLKNGIYNIHSYYDGDDYKVSNYSYDDYYHGSPKINYSYRYIVGGNNTILIELSKPSKGEFMAEIYKDDDKYNSIRIPIISNKATLPISNLPFGRYEVHFKYVGEDSIPDSSCYFSINPNYTDIPEYMNSNKKENVKFILPSNENPKLNVKINWNSIDVPIINGVASIPLDNLRLGENILTISYSDDKYGKWSSTHWISVTKASSDIIFKHSVSGDNSIFDIELSSDATGNVVLFADCKTYDQIISNGKVSFTIPKLSSNYGKVIVAYSGDEKYEQCSKILLKEEQHSDYGIFNNVTKNYGVVSLNENCIINQTIKINGSNVIINGNGFTIDALNKYIIHIIGDNVCIRNITIKNAISSRDGGAIYISGSNATIISSTFINNTAYGDGGAILIYQNNAKIIDSTFINNTAYGDGGAIGYYAQFNTLITNPVFENNKALSENPSTQNIAILNSTNNQNNNNSNDTIKDNTNNHNKDSYAQNNKKTKKQTPKITAKKATFKAKKKSKKYTILLKVGKKPVKKVRVYLKIGKKTYKAITKRNGKAVFKIRLNKKGTYKAKITFKGNKNYNKVTKTVQIKIK